MLWSEYVCRSLASYFLVWAWRCPSVLRKISLGDKAEVEEGSIGALDFGLGIFNSSQKLWLVQSWWVDGVPGIRASHQEVEDDKVAQRALFE